VPAPQWFWATLAGALMLTLARPGAATHANVDTGGTDVLEAAAVGQAEQTVTRPHDFHRQQEA